MSYLSSKLLAVSNTIEESVLVQESKNYENLSKESFIGYLNSLTTWLLGIVAIIAVASAIYAGYTLITSGGDEKKPAMAKKMLLYSVLGVIVVLLSKGIITFAVSILELK